MWMADISNISEAATPDLSDMVSTNGIDNSSMFANYGDDTCDQFSLGEYLYKWLNSVAQWCNYMFSIPLYELLWLKPVVVGTSHLMFLQTLANTVYI